MSFDEAFDMCRGRPVIEDELIPVVEVEKCPDPMVVVAEAQDNFAGYRSNCP
jgi:hypothetical protein